MTACRVPPIPRLAAAQAGHGADDGKCFVTGGNAALYRETEGIVPWKEPDPAVSCIAADCVSTVRLGAGL